MTTPLLDSVDEGRLRTIALEDVPISPVQPPEGATGDPINRRYLEVLPPRTALELIGELRELRRALEGAVGVLEGTGFTRQAYLALDEAERASPPWSAVRRAWEAVGTAPGYLLRYTRGSEHGVRTFPTREAALAAAIEALEMRESDPEAVETEGGLRLLDRTAILRAWEERHDPG